ncbi:PEP-CTERM sorting domain-containing protein [Roseiconus lacunae]|uniref:PEP-CTERM sorting domain-containing protein n=1 Tax=Roseiconus lacunae TaxID=2605694 RepID=UPI0011F1C59A|nr:PEP-CTERM sorting domain-containing protein [Roseiconus lacunae]
MLRCTLAICALLIGSVTHAGFLGTFLTPNGTVDQIRTNTTPVGRASLSGGDFTPSVGEQVFGFIASDTAQNDVNLTSPFNPGAPVAGGGVENALTGGDVAVAVFAGELVDLGGGLLGLDSSTFGLADVLGAEFAAQLAIAPDALVAVFTGNYDGGVNAMVSGSGGDLITAGGSNDIATAINGADFDLEFLAGIGRAGNFFSSTSLTGLLSQQRAGLDVLASFNGLAYKDVPASPLPDTLPPPIVPAQVALDNTFVSANPSLTGGFNLSTTASDLRINTVPEPASLAIFAGIAIAGFGRRKRGRSC